MKRQAAPPLEPPARHRFDMVVLTAGLFALAASPLEAQMRAATGTYVGDLVDGRAVTVGFAPDVVIVKGDGVVGTEAVVRTSTMVGDISKGLGTAAVATVDLIQSFTAGGFTVGADTRVNDSGVTYHWTALKAFAGELQVGTYTGNSIDGTVIPVAFQPDWVAVFGMSAVTAVHRSVTMTGDSTAAFRGTLISPPADMIQNLLPGGFEVGLNLNVNGNTLAYHYVAVKHTPGRFASGLYQGDLNDNRNITGLGFQPIHVLIKMTTSVQAGVFRPDTLQGDQSLFFTSALATSNKIQALLADGFQVGQGANVNAGSTHTHVWAAFGGTVNYRSIGAAPDYIAGTVEGTPGSPVVTGTGTQWFTANRGRGDRILIDGTNYTILAVDSQTQLRLTTAYVGTPGPGKAHTISRQYTTLQAWESCISFLTPVSCSYFQVPSGNLVTDLRSEVGIAYDDAVGADFAGGLVFDGSVTDAGHTITLTADGGNRHFGLLGQGVVIDNGASVTPAIGIQDDFVTVEWMEVRGGGGSADGIRVEGLLSAGTSSLARVRNNLIHNVAGDGISTYDADGRADLINNVVHSNAGWGLWVNPAALVAGSRFRVLNNTFYNNTQAGIEKNPGAGAATLLLRNNISFGNGGAEYTVSSLDPTSSHNLSSDATATPASPAGNAQTGVTLTQIAFFSTIPGSENLHIRFASVAREQGADLSATLADDIDGITRPVAANWDKGADEAETQVQFRSIGTAADLTNQGLITVTVDSTIVTKAGGTGWKAANRGRGDRLTVGANHYMIRSVDSDNQLTLILPAVANYISQPTYTIARQFETFQQWQDCISRSAVNTCKRPADTQEYFATLSSSLVADDRREIGIAYEDSVFTPAAQVLFAGATTDTTHTVTLTADGTNRHYGVAGAGVVIDGLGANVGFRIDDNNYTVEWLEFRNIYGVNDEASILIRSAALAQTGVLLQNLLIHDFFDGTANVIKGIGIQGNGGKDITIRNVMIWNGDQKGIEGDAVNDFATIENCTVHGMANYGIDAFHSQFVIRNTIATGNPSGDFVRLQADGSLTGSNNTSSDATAGGPPAVFANAQTSVPASALYLDFTGPVLDLHLQPAAVAVNTGLDLAASFSFDIDGQLRPAGAGWDRGADEQGATTEVSLHSFTAIPANAAVRLEWRTASELTNLGFHVYRSLSEKGPWTRLTSSLIPGLGSSAVGQAYSFRDAGLTNGTRYFYRLEDVDASSKATSHGPVWAVPSLASAPEDGSGSGNRGSKKGTTDSSCPDWVLAAYGSAAGSDAAEASLRCTRHGDPEAVSLGVVSRDSRQATLELRTGGFYALHTQSGAGEPAGTVRVFVPGFDFPQDEKAAALPIRRALTDAVVGRRVQLGGVRALDLVSFKGLVPSSLGKAEMQVGWDGTVRAARRGSRPLARQFPKSELATLLPSLFQGETKSAVVEIAPLRFDAQRQQLVLAKRVRVRLLFTGREAGESGRGSLGRAPGSRKPVVSGETLARLYTTSRGLHSVTFEQLSPGQRRGMTASQLRLERQGEPVAFHLEPSSSAFGPGSRLFFYADTTAASTDFSAEVAYALVRATDGVPMPLQSAAPGSNSLASASVVLRSFETNRFYQPGLLDAPDPWLWEALSSGATRVKSFALSGVSGSGTAELDVDLQGASESGQPVDHHVSLSLNGTPVGEAQFAGKKPYRISLSLPASLLREGTNELSLTNVADTGVSSLVFLDRFILAHPQASLLAGGRFEGTWPEGGTASVSGASGGIFVLDVTDASGPSAAARWLTGLESSGGSLRFHAEAGRLYVAVGETALLTPRVASREPSTLRATTNQADYLLIAPRAFLAAAAPLVERRQDQGLQARAVSLEEIASEFGHGQASAEAIKAFLAFAFHSWARPSPRYVLLLGDSTYDPRNFIGTSQPSPLPALWTKTSYLWTVSDPRLAAVNGEDKLPDLAIGRLPAATVEQAEALVQKLLAWEDSGQGLAGSAALVADNPDLAGDFEGDVRDIASSYLGGRNPELLLLSELGPETRPRILDALNSGLSYLNYVGHGGAAVWASENVWNSWDAASLQAQSQQPLLVTMNCLNGYFVAPTFESLSESLLKAEGRGAIASFSPSGLSLDGPAHQYHRALMAALTSGQHARLGDAVLAAQKTYAESGLMPELLGVYHLLGDPAMSIQ